MVQTIAREVAAASRAEKHAYLWGASHDSTLSKAHATTRFCQGHLGWLEVLKNVLEGVGYRSWIYREGRTRSVWVLETRWRHDDRQLQGIRDSAAYLRGYFDAEGGVPKDDAARFYIQLVQKNHRELSQLRSIATRLGLSCGKLHNPSWRVDPNYWRFYVRRCSQIKFIKEIGSWHPRKRERLEVELRRSTGLPAENAVRSGEPIHVATRRRAGISPQLTACVEGELRRSLS